MKISDNMFKKIEKKTNVDKNTILSLAEKLQNSNMKNEDVLRDVVKQLSVITGKEISKEKEDKIIKAVITSDVSKDVENMLD